MTIKNTLDISVQNTQSLIADFIANNSITDDLITTFGTNFNPDTGVSLLESLANGDFTIPIEIRDRFEINNANGAYSASHHTIYLSTELIASGDVEAVTRTLLEETGHYLDSQVNTNDAPGDEGAIFASLVLGEELDSNQLELLKAEDDTAIVELDGETRTIEQEGIIYVNASSSGENDGSSWTNAYTDLQSALAVAGNGDQIWVADGTYVPTSDTTNEESREISFVIPSGVELYGGFAGGETALFERDYENNETILSGNIGEDTAGDNSYHVVDITNTTASTILDGVTISDGRADGEVTGFSIDDGGGIFGRNNASATIRNSIVVNNTANGDGGGLIVGIDSSVNIINTIFKDNVANGTGGGIYLTDTSSPNIINSIFYGNESQEGGAIYVRDSISTSPNNLKIANSTFFNNTAGTGDSIFYALRDIHTYDNNIFWNTEGRNDNQIFINNAIFPIINNSIVQGGYEGEGSEKNTTEDPLFVNPDNNDFRLQLTSPGIDAGNNEALDEEKDLVGNPRIFNDTVDIGAYEYSVLMSINNADLEEGDSDTTNLEFTVTLLDSLGEAATEEITINYATVDNTATAGEDYTATEGTLVFGVGDTTKTISVPIIGDELIENDETFDLELSGLTGNAALVDDSGAGTITNDDEPKQITIADATLEEADEGEKTLEFTISLNETYVEDITVDYNLIEDTATVDEDYTDLDGTLTFEPGEKEKTVSVAVKGDMSFEADETFFLQLSNSSDNATIEDDRAIGTITNDDKEAEPIALTQTINRFQNSDIQGTYLFAGNEESANIRDNFTNFEEEGVAFKVSFEPGDDLIPLYRFQSIPNPGTYLFAGAEERQGILENFAESFTEEGLAFYVYGVGEEKGTTFYRFQNEDKPGTYLFAGPEERANILENFPNFTEEGPAFEVGV